MRWLLLTTMLLVPLAASADDGGPADAGDGGDISLPDASQGQGGADQTSQEGDDNADRPATTCRSTQDCSQGFECQAGHCTWTGYRPADRVGCLFGADAAALGGLGLVIAGGKRRRQRRR